MIRRPPRSTRVRSSAASDVYKRQVQKIINNVFADGQLDECELTLKDLHHIARSFNKILSGIFHQRIQYPQAIDKKKSHDNLDKQPPKNNGTKSGEAPEKSREAVSYTHLTLPTILRV